MIEQLVRDYEICRKDLIYSYNTTINQLKELEIELATESNNFFMSKDGNIYILFSAEHIKILENEIANCKNKLETVRVDLLQLEYEKQHGFTC